MESVCRLQKLGEVRKPMFAQREEFVVQRPVVTIDGNEAAALVAYRASEVIAIYPITPASPMGELCDAWSAAARPNLLGTVPRVMEMQSEAGAAGVVHGALQAGALTTTFTASQGLLLMIPNMYKIAGELTPCVIHVAARSLATHALSIFGDHSDVMAVRGAGWAMLCSSSVQETHDFALIAHAATLRMRIPVLHFFDGFRTSHEIAKIQQLAEEDLRVLLDEALICEHRRRALSPDRPVLRGTAQNPDVFFQAREAANAFYEAAPGIVQRTMDEFGQQVGRSYHLFEFVGHPQADRVLVLMGSGCGAAEEAVTVLAARGERVGMIKVRLFRPFASEQFLAALPEAAHAIAVLDRTKEPGASGEPLLQEVACALSTARRGVRHLIGGRYGLSSKEFTPAMAAAALQELAQENPRPRFTLGIVDDVTHLSLPAKEEAFPEPADVFRAVFYGLGSDGTVGANKNSVKIIAENTALFAQGYFVYDSKKAGSVTVSHLRFSPRPIQSTYLIRQAQFVACHQFSLLDRMDVLERAAAGATFLLNSPYPADQVWQRLPANTRRRIRELELKFYVVNADEVAQNTGMGRRINTVMQVCFFALSEMIPPAAALDQIKQSIQKTYGKRGETVVARNFAAVDQAAASLQRVAIPVENDDTHTAVPPPPVGENFEDRVLRLILAGQGDRLPVSALPVDGTFPTGTACLEKRSIAAEIPIWDADICIDCGLCALVCPHAAIRLKLFPGEGDDRPEDFVVKPYGGKEFPGYSLRIQVAPDDCTGCGVCVDVCPARSKEAVRHKAINMEPKEPHLERERRHFDYFLGIPEIDRSAVRDDTVKGSQALLPLFEFPGACAGCGETP